MAYNPNINLTFTTEGGITFTWHRRTGLVMDPAARLAKIQELLTLHAPQPGEPTLPLSIPKLNLTAVPTTKAFRAALYAWSTPLVEDATAQLHAEMKRRGHRIPEAM